MGCKRVIPFKKVWEDSLTMISKDEVKELNIVETYKGGFVEIGRAHV